MKTLWVVVITAGATFGVMFMAGVALALTPGNAVLPMDEIAAARTQAYDLTTHAAEVRDNIWHFEHRTMPQLRGTPADYRDFIEASLTYAAAVDAYSETMYLVASNSLITAEEQTLADQSYGTYLVAEATMRQAFADSPLGEMWPVTPTYPTYVARMAADALP